MCRYGEPLSEEVKDFPTTVLAASCVGFAFGGMIGARHAGDKFIAMNHHSKFSSTMQAQVQWSLTFWPIPWYIPLDLHYGSIIPMPIGPE